MSNKPKILVVNNFHGDWEAVYVDGKCFDQNHSVNMTDLLEHLGEKGLVSFSTLEVETDDRFPEDLRDLEENDDRIDKFENFSELVEEGHRLALEFDKETKSMRTFTQEELDMVSKNK